MRATLLLIISLLVVPSWADNNTDPSGLWNTFDDNGDIESTVEVRVEGVSYTQTSLVCVMPLRTTLFALHAKGIYMANLSSACKLLTD